MSDDPTPIKKSAEARVVQIEDLRVARGLTRRPVSSCRHATLVYDDHERRIWCEDCESEIHPFDAFTNLVTRMDAHHEDLRRREGQIREAESYALQRRASKAIDEKWRSRNMVPCCPHCSHGLFPEHFANGGISMMGRDYAEKQLARAKAEKKVRTVEKE